jgi:hypothetical protein
MARASRASSQQTKLPSTFRNFQNSPPTTTKKNKFLLNAAQAVHTD